MKLKFLYPAMLMVAFLEGGVLMAFEILSSKMYTPYLGSSIYVWTSILTLTLSGLALGYKICGKLSVERPTNYLIYVLLIASVLIGISPLIAPIVLESLLLIDVKTASIIGGFILIFIPVIALGIVSPLIVGILEKNGTTIPHATGVVYGIGTLGGILFLLITTFYLIPKIGVMCSTFLMSGILLLATIGVFKFMKRANA